jgi:hypothetical protein
MCIRFAQGGILFEQSAEKFYRQLSLIDYYDELLQYGSIGTGQNIIG